MQTYTFIANDAMRGRALKVLRAHSLRHKVLLLLSVAALIWIVVCFVLVNGSLANNTVVEAGPAEYSAAGFTNAVLAGTLTCIFGVAPFVLILQLRRVCVDFVVTKKLFEQLSLLDDGLMHSYEYKNIRSGKTYYEYKRCNTAMRYQDIQRIELYEEDQVLKVYGRVYFCNSPDMPASEADVVRVLDDPRNAYRVFFLYYDDAEFLVQALSQRSGVPVNRLGKCTGSLHEVKNKGVG